MQERPGLLALVPMNAADSGHRCAGRGVRARYPAPDQHPHAPSRQRCRAGARSHRPEPVPPPQRHDPLHQSLRFRRGCRCGRLERSRMSSRQGCGRRQGHRRNGATSAASSMRNFEPARRDRDRPSLPHDQPSQSTTSSQGEHVMDMTSVEREGLQVGSGSEAVPLHDWRPTRANLSGQHNSSGRRRPGLQSIPRGATCRLFRTRDAGARTRGPRSFRMALTAPAESPGPQDPPGTSDVDTGLPAPSLSDSDRLCPAGPRHRCDVEGCGSWGPGCTGRRRGPGSSVLASAPLCLCRTGFAAPPVWRAR
jgi:hypothetical protein